MSGTSKIIHEEGGHSSSAKYSHEESGSVFPNLSGKPISSVANEYHAPTEMGPDSRMAKVPRNESRDTGKRSPLHSTYRMPSASSNDSNLDHLSNASENRLESRDFKDKEPKEAENRDSKVVARGFYSEPKRDLLNVKSEKVERFENKGVDNKEIKYDKNTHNDLKGEIKIEWSPHMYGKEPKEHHRGYLDNWRTSNTSLPGPVVYAKEGLPIEERDNIEAHKAVGENKDLKGEDKFKEKDKKWQDAKHRDGGEVESGKYDHANNFQLSNNNSECKESTMEDREAERTLGKTQVSSVVYKSGECMQGLSKLWKEYELSEAAKNCESSQRGPTLEIRIPAEYVTATNRQVRGGQLWGTDIYTDDSDLVAVLMHTGYLRPTSSTPPPAIQELSASIRVLPPQDCYVSSLRNNVRSRAWGAAIGCSYCVERCCIVKKGGGTINLEPCLTHTSTVEPTLAPVAVERTMTTRAAASNALRQQRFVREVTIQYNLCNEPWIKYSISIVADKGLKKPFYTSARLKKGEVLYLETHSKRYELCYAGEKTVKVTPSSHVNEAEAGKSQNNLQIVNGEKSLTESDVIIDAFRWSRCKKILPQKAMPVIGIPLPVDYVEVLEDNLDWEDIQWSQSGVWIANKEYTLARVHFLTPN